MGVPCVSVAGGCMGRTCLVDVDKHNRDVDQFNSRQKDVLRRVMEHLKSVEMEFRGLLLYVSGVGGTGKSFLINTIADAVELIYGVQNDGQSKPAILLSAPTGLAAISICGQTLHSLLGIKVLNGGEAVYESLSDENRDMRRILFENVKLMIIDEISMVSATMLAKISNRLKEIMENNKDFGGLSVLVYGDLCQLPPVNAPPVFSDLSSYVSRKIFGGMDGGPNIWHKFEYIELVENMRQREDPIIADTLNRVRIGDVSEDDLSLLRTRVVFDTNSTLADAAQFYVHISER